MHKSVCEELKLKTSAFWKLSQVWNGKCNIQITTGEAIEICNTIIDSTNYCRPLSYRTDTLLQEIIKGEGTKVTETKIIPFEKPIKKQKRSRK